MRAFFKRIGMHIALRIKVHRGWVLRLARSWLARLRAFEAILLHAGLDLLILTFIMPAIAGLAFLITPNTGALHRPEFWLILTGSSALAMLLARAYFRTYQAREAKYWTTLNDELDKPLAPDSGEKIALIELRPKAFASLLPPEVKNAAAYCTEIMILLRQCATTNDSDRYDLACLQDQMKKITTIIADALKDLNRKEVCRAKREKRTVQPQSIAINWVCFVDRKGRFAAYQGIGPFNKQLCKSDNNQYASILNIRKTWDFHKAIKENLNAYDAKQNGGDKFAIAQTDIPFTQILPGLCRRRRLPKLYTRLQALKLMQKRRWPDAMVVSASGFEPRGIVTLYALLKPVLMDVIARQEHDIEKHLRGTRMPG